MNWYLEVLQKYLVFSGRARRKEYWMFILFSSIFAVVAAIIDNVLGIDFQSLGYGPIYLLYTLATLLPMLGVAFRRLHDVGKSGWFLLINLIPLIGPIWLLIVLCGDSTPGENKYGPNPKE